eukprot:CAMPEP_0116020414 /NCGR_PEP_ID=MMETSP0321-20121206/9780_1 /TAXON_ID=163516 /ORGANISM="Leptocylindrus danicus var. danicus, Strain B650" /LENGTH=741 /DNA_ID=CAMNT_0003491095 /DNA_START=89 /DNA_END=2314 /DNA_ORIENTATION=+
MSLPCFIRGFGSILHQHSKRNNYPRRILLTSPVQCYGSRSSALFSSASSSDEINKKAKKKNGRKKKKSDEYNFDSESLKSAFDRLAEKDGVDYSNISSKQMAELRRIDAEQMAFFAEHADEGDEIVSGNLEFDEDGEYSLEYLDNDDDFLDFGDDDDVDDSPGSSMKARLEAAKKDMVAGRVSVPEELDNFARGASPEALRKIGFRHEENPFGTDETPRNPLYKLDMKPMECPACGAYFQSKDVSKPGFLPPEKHKEQMKLAKRIAEEKKLETLQDEEAEWSTDDEIEWLLKTEGKDPEQIHKEEEEKMEKLATMGDQLDDELLERPKKRTICQRCHNLQNFGDIDASLRPGWTEEPLLSQETFRELLRPIREKEAVIIALVDLFDFSGSVLPELDSIAGSNPVVLAANKADLLPSKMGQLRAENWVRRELEYMGIKSLANIGGAVRLVSCKTGFGISQLLRKVRELADERDCDVYIVGAANAGKSTLLNRLLHSALEDDKEKTRRKKRAGNANAIKGQVTTSPLPGTTLKFIKVDLGNGRKMYDTPGLIVPGTLTSRLTPAELKMVVPKKPVEAVSFRVGPGKCVLIGGLARIEVASDSKPFLFTFFVSNDIKLHPTDASKADEVLRKLAGDIITPPLGPGPERLDQIGSIEYHDVEIDGAGWKEAAADISLRGIGWIAVTGAGIAKVKIGVPEGIGVAVRPPLMPFDMWEATAKYTGGRAIRKGGKTKTGKYRSGVGRR